MPKKNAQPIVDSPSLSGVSVENVTINPVTNEVTSVTVVKDAFLVKDEDGNMKTVKGSKLTSLMDYYIDKERGTFTVALPGVYFGEIPAVSYDTTREYQEKVPLLVMQEKRGSASMQKTLEQIEHHRDLLLGALIRLGVNYEYMTGSQSSVSVAKEKAKNDGINEGKRLMLASMPEELLKALADSKGISDVLDKEEIIEQLVAVI